MVGAAVFRRHIGKRGGGGGGGVAYVVIPLMGVFKWYTGSRNHLQVFVSNTESKLKVS